MVTEQLQRRIDACTDCAAECRSCADHCSTMGMTDGVDLCMECAQHCDQCVQTMRSGSNEHCQHCAEVCERCAGFCEGMPDDAQMAECARACRRCAEECYRSASTSQ